jgi:hypothetical protein
MPPRRVSCRVLLEVGLLLLGGTPALSRSVSLASQIKSFKSVYGSHPLVYSKIWKDLTPFDDKGSIKHFLITLYWFKNYDAETDLSLNFELSDKTI